MRRKYRLTENGLRRVVKNVVNEWFGVDVPDDYEYNDNSSNTLFVLIDRSREPRGIFDSVEAAAKFAASEISKNTGQDAEQVLNSIKAKGKGFHSSGGYDEEWGFGIKDYDCYACPYYKS